MKTAISLPEEIFSAAEEAAHRLGMSRSQLYARAVAEFLERHRGMGVREALDSVYTTESSRVDPVLFRMQASSIPEEDW